MFSTSYIDSVDPRIRYVPSLGVHAGRAALSGLASTALSSGALQLGLIMHAMGMHYAYWELGEGRRSELTSLLDRLHPFTKADQEPFALVQRNLLEPEGTEIRLRFPMLGVQPGLDIARSLFDDRLMPANLSSSYLASTTRGYFQNLLALYNADNDVNKAVLDCTASIRPFPEAAPMFESYGSSWGWDKGDYKPLVLDLRFSPVTVSILCDEHPRLLDDLVSHFPRNILEHAASPDGQQNYAEYRRYRFYDNPASALRLASQEAMKLRELQRKIG